MRKIIFIFKVPVLSICFVCALCCFLQTGQALAAAPAYTATLIAGPYTIDVSLSQNPPFTDQPFEVIVGAHSGNQQFSGQVVAEPGLGTDAVPLHAQLLPLAGSPGKIGGSLHLPVRGAWQLVVNVKWTAGTGQRQYRYHSWSTRRYSSLAGLGYRRHSTRTSSPGGYIDNRRYRQQAFN